MTSGSYDPPADVITEGVVRRFSARDAARLIEKAGEDVGERVSGVGHAVVLKAKTQLGVRETPPGSNRGVPLARYVRWFTPESTPVPWCTHFVSWCFDQVTDRNRRVPWRSAGIVRAVRLWRPHVQVPLHGDFFGVGDQHMGVVWEVNTPARTIRTIEGNYSDAVVAVERRWPGLWFVRP